MFRASFFNILESAASACRAFKISNQAFATDAVEQKFPLKLKNSAYLSNTKLDTSDGRMSNISRYSHGIRIFIVQPYVKKQFSFFSMTYTNLLFIPPHTSYSPASFVHGVALSRLSVLSIYGLSATRIFSYILLCCQPTQCLEGVPWY